MAEPKAEALIALEQSLSERLQRRWLQSFNPILKRLRKAIEDDDIIAAQDAIESIDRIPDIHRGMIRYMEYIGTAAYLLGASRVQPLEETTAAQELTATPKIVKQATKQLEIFLREGRKTVKKQAYRVLQRFDRDRMLARDKAATTNTIQKADLVPKLDDYLATVSKTGVGTIDVASSLHTSRLSNYGFTVEALVTGVENYQVDEQLDSRTCPVCQAMHGKTFNVERTFGRLQRILETTDPEDLKAIAPFPKQDAETLARMNAMSLEELEAAGYSSPPYHPMCRGLLAAGGTIVDADSVTVLDIQAERELDEFAKTLFRQAQEDDKITTPFIKDLAKELKASFPKAPRPTDPLGIHGTPVKEGSLFYRLKSEDSLKSKINRYMIKDGSTIEQAARKVPDSLRYTYVFETRDYTKNVEKTIATLKSKGWTDIDAGNAWKRTDYKGVNLNARTPNGTMVELQLHTAQSFEVKTYMNHEMFEEWREILPKVTGGKLTKKQLARKELLEGLMAENVRKHIPLPPDYEKLILIDGAIGP